MEHKERKAQQAHKVIRDLKDPKVLLVPKARKVQLDHKEKQAHKEMLEHKMADADFYNDQSKDAIAKAQRELGVITKAIEEREVAWMEAQELHDQKEVEFSASA